LGLACGSDPHYLELDSLSSPNILSLACLPDLFDFLKKIIYKNLDKKLTHQVLYLKKNAKHAIFLIMK
jgi:hypothetical protein